MSRKIDNYQYFPSVGTPCDFADKSKSVAEYTKYMLSRTTPMFRYTGLPPEIPAWYLEQILQTTGYVIIAPVNGKLYAFNNASLGGEPDYRGHPTIATINNPALKYNAQLRIGEDCVLGKSDHYMMGLLPICNRYATMLAENDITLMMADTNSRAQMIISAQDDRTAKAAKIWIDKLKAGDLDVIAETAFLDGLKVNPYANGSQATALKETLELRQYIRGTWFNDIGVQANYNSKRESLNSSETGMNEDSLIPFSDDMIDCRHELCDDVERLFGSQWAVELGSVWETLQKEVSTGEEDPETSGRNPAEPDNAE